MADGYNFAPLPNGTYVSTLGLSSGTDDTAAIQALLTAARTAGVGYVRGLPGQTYIATSLVLGSGVTLDLTGCVVNQKAGATQPLLRNYGSDPVATGTGSITAGSAVLTTALTAVAGQTVTIAGADGAGTTTFTGTVVSVGSGTLTLDTTAKTTVSGAVTKVFTRDVGVKVIGGKYNRGGNGSAAHSLYFRHVDGLTVYIDGFTSTVGKYAVSVASVTDLDAKVRGLNGFSDGLHLMGPVDGANIIEVSGTTGDDLFAITASDWVAYGDSSGDVKNVTIGHIHGKTNANLCKIIAGAGNVVDAVQIGTVSGKAALNGLWIGDDTGQASTTGGTYGTVDAELVEWEPTGTGNAVVLQAPVANRIRVGSVRPLTTGFGYAVQVGGVSTATVGQLEIGVDVAGGAGALNVNNASVTLDSVIITGRVNQAAVTGANNHVNINAGTVTDLEMRGVRGIHGPTPSTTVGVVSTGQLSRVRFIGGSYAGGNSLVRTRAGGSATIVTLAPGTYLSGYGRVMNSFATTTLILESPILDTISLAAVFVSTGPCVIKGDVTTVGTFTLLQRLGSEVVQVIGLGIPADLSTLAKNNGDRANNTNGALACGVGPAICNGTNWKNVYSGSVY